MGMIKNIIIIIVLLNITACSPYLGLSKKIENTQIIAWHESPFNQPKIEVKDKNIIYVGKPQPEFRKIRLEHFFSYKGIELSNLSDTLVLLESYDFTCLGCPSKIFQIFYKDTVYAMNWSTGKSYDDFELEKHRLSFDSNNFEYKLENSIFIELIPKIRKEDNWAENTLQYGSKDCLDGDISYLTVIYPDLKIKSIYVRCWVPYIYRK